MSAHPDPTEIDLSDRRRWLTAEQAATIARADPRTVWRWIASGKARAVKTPGGRVFVDRHSLFEPVATREMSRDASARQKRDPDLLDILTAE